MVLYGLAPVAVKDGRRKLLTPKERRGMAPDTWWVTVGHIHCDLVVQSDDEQSTEAPARPLRGGSYQLSVTGLTTGRSGMAWISRPREWLPEGQSISGKEKSVLRLRAKWKMARRTIPEQLSGRRVTTTIDVMSYLDRLAIDHTPAGRAHL